MLCQPSLQQNRCLELLVGSFDKLAESAVVDGLENAEVLRFGPVLGLAVD